MRVFLSKVLLKPWDKFAKHLYEAAEMLLFQLKPLHRFQLERENRPKAQKIGNPSLQLSRVSKFSRLQKAASEA